MLRRYADGKRKLFQSRVEGKMELKDLKKLSRLYISETSLHKGAEIELNKDQTHYLKNVMRRNEGDFIRFFNGRDGEWLAEISRFKKNQCFLVLKEKLAEQKKSSDVWAVASVVKKDALDLMVEKSCELGASEFFPIRCDNTVVHKINRERLQLISIEAAEQSERLDVMAVSEVLAIAKLIDSNKERKFVVCLERAMSFPLMKVFKQNKESDLAVVVGPEGGFSEAEVQILSMKTNVVFASLGDNILRAETALIAALAVLNAVSDV